MLAEYNRCLKWGKIEKTFSFPGVTLNFLVTFVRQKFSRDAFIPISPEWIASLLPNKTDQFYIFIPRGMINLILRERKKDRMKKFESWYLLFYSLMKILFTCSIRDAVEKFLNCCREIFNYVLWNVPTSLIILGENFIHERREKPYFL